MTKVSEGLRLARENGDKFYFGDKPCKHGNCGPRYIKGAGCACDECKAEKLEYRNGRKEITKEINRKHHERNRDALIAKMRVRNPIYRENNLEELKRKEKVYRDNNKELRAATNKAYRERNKEIISQKKTRIQLKESTYQSCCKITL